MVSLDDFSKELCGGTHTGATGNIGLFKIIEESSVASGVRRIEALTGEAAFSHIQKTDKLLGDTSRLLKERSDAVPRRIEKMLSLQKSMEKEIEQLKVKIDSRATETLEDAVQSIDGIKVLVKKVSVDTPAALRNLADRFKDKIKSGIIVLGSVSESKVLLIAVVTKDLLDRYHAGNIVKEISTVVGGGGGGRPDMAQAGGTKPEKLDQALEKAYEVVKKS